MKYIVFIKKRGVYWLITLSISLLIFTSTVLLENELIYNNVVIEKLLKLEK